MYAGFVLGFTMKHEHVTPFFLSSNTRCHGKNARNGIVNKRVEYKKRKGKPQRFVFHTQKVHCKKRKSETILDKPGPAQVGAISKAQK